MTVKRFLEKVEEAVSDFPFLLEEDIEKVFFSLTSEEK